MEALIIFVGYCALCCDFLRECPMAFQLLCGRAAWRGAGESMHWTRSLHKARKALATPRQEGNGFACAPQWGTGAVGGQGGVQIRLTTQAVTLN